MQPKSAIGKKVAEKAAKAGITAGSSITSIDEMADGIHGAIVRARKPA